MRDVPLKDAVIAVNPSKKGRPPEVRVFRLYDPKIAHYEFTTGAGESRWDNQPSHRLGILHEALWFMAHTFRIPTEIIHDAMQDIPEYRELE